MSTSISAASYMKYLDMQAYVGITKHIGGFAATDELLSLCHVKTARAVLNVGCGIGVTSTYIARAYGCHVVGVDVSEKMIEWSRLRAKEEKMEDRVELQTASVLNLPFAADHFDVVIAESVLSFVKDKRRAIQECVRVTRPGGYVGINETIWLELPSAEMTAQIGKYIGADIVTTEGWRDLWKESGLQEQVIQTHLVDARAEIRDRIQWVGWRWALRGFSRLLRLYVTDPAARQPLKEQFATPATYEMMRQVGYALLVGRK